MKEAVTFFVCCLVWLSCLPDEARAQSKQFNVKTDFGAVGDGQANDTEAVQNAINAALAHAEKRTVFFPSGSYKITSQLLVGSNLTLLGAGFSSILKITTPDVGIGAGSLRDFTIGRLTLTGQVRKMIVLGGGSNLNVKNCRISGATRSPAGAAPEVTAAIYLGPVEDVWITSNTFTNNGHNSTNTESSEIYLASSAGSRRVHIRNNQITGRNTKFGVAMFDVFDSDVIGNNIDQGDVGTSSNTNGYGILIYATTLTKTIRNNIVTGNNVFNTYGSGIYLVASLDSLVADNTVTETAKHQDDSMLPVGGISLNDSDRTTVAGNTVAKAVKSGIVVVGNSIAVTGNTIKDVGGVNGGIVLRGSYTGVSVTGNTIDDSYRGIYGSNTAMSYTITGNRITNPVSNGIYLESASYTTIANNNVQASTTQGVIIVAGDRNNVVNNITRDGSNACYDIRSTRSLLLGNEARNCEIGFQPGNQDNVLIDNQIVNIATQAPANKKQKRKSSTGKIANR